VKSLVQEALRLTTEQQECLLKARNTYLAEVGRLLEERRKLQTTLRVSNPCPPLDCQGFKLECQHGDDVSLSWELRPALRRRRSLHIARYALGTYLNT